MSADCLFCKMIRGEIPSKKVFESDSVYAFEDIHPQAPTHLLFIPKKHFSNLNEVTPEHASLFSDLFLAIKTVAEQKQVAESGYRCVINTNIEGGQTVYHLHVHLIAGRQLGGNMAG